MRLAGWLRVDHRHVSLTIDARATIDAELRVALCTRNILRERNAPSGLDALKRLGTLFARFISRIFEQKLQKMAGDPRIGVDR